MKCQYCRDTKKITLLTSTVDCLDCPKDEDNKENHYQYVLSYLNDGTFFLCQADELDYYSQHIKMVVHQYSNIDNANKVLQILNTKRMYPNTLVQDAIYAGNLDSNDIYLSNTPNKEVVFVFSNLLDEHRIQDFMPNGKYGDLYWFIYDIYNIHKLLGKI